MIVCDTNILSTRARVGILELLFKLFPKSTLPRSFGPGELEGVVICARRNSIFLTNDKRVRNYCQEHGIEVYDLALLLRTLWRKRKEGSVKKRGAKDRERYRTARKNRV